MIDDLERGGVSASDRRDDELRELEGLRQAVKIGDDSGLGMPADEIFAELRRMIATQRTALE